MEQRQTVVINQNLATVGSSTWTVDLGQYQVDFVPTHCCVRSIIYCQNVGGVDNGVFQLWSSLTQQAISNTYNFIQGAAYAPMNTFSIKQFTRQVQFQIIPVGGPIMTAAAGAPAPPTGFVSFILEFTG